MHNNKRKQCCECKKTFTETKKHYRLQDDTSMQDMMEGYFEEPYEVLTNETCPHCGSTCYIIV